MFLPKATQHQRQRSAPRPPHPPNPEAHQLLTSLKFATKLSSSQSKCEKTSRYYLQFRTFQRTPVLESQAWFICSIFLPQGERTSSAKTTRRASITLFQVWKYVIELLLCQSPVELSLRDKNLRIRQNGVQIPALPLSVCETLDKCQMGIVIAPTSQCCWDD